MFAGNYAPVGWAFCNGAPIPIAENDALFVVIGTTYGGDGQSTFALPDLRSRVPIHRGNGFIVGEMGGVEEVTLTTQQIPVHTHPLVGTDNLASEPNPNGNVPARSTTLDLYLEAPDPGPSAPMNPASVVPVGGSQPHTNIQPYLAINFIIALYGIFPTPS
jgi:microcystin-dependent protein